MVSFRVVQVGQIRRSKWANLDERLGALSGPAREGLALLQGLLYLATVAAPSPSAIWQRRHLSVLSVQLVAPRRLGYQKYISSRCNLLDAAISEEVLKALQPAELEIALAALRELEGRDQTILRQWQMRLERARYEAALAERRYQEVDPSNRLVAGTLERRWNDALVHLDDLKKQAVEFQRHEELGVATPSEG